METRSIAIIDYQMSNLFSISNVLKELNFNPIITSDPSTILKCSGAILPGVGSFSEAMKNIKRFSIDEAIKEFVLTEKPFMGICLGLQLLFEESEEFENFEGMGIIEGKCSYFKNIEKVKTVPHVGWNAVKFNYVNNNNKQLTEGISEKEYFYFVHSLYVNPLDKRIIKSVTNHDGFEFCSSIMHKNIFATQFHPEKSGKNGLRLLKNFFSS